MNDGTPIRPTRNVELGASGEEFQNLHEFVAQGAHQPQPQQLGLSDRRIRDRDHACARNRLALDAIALPPARAARRVEGRRVGELFGRKLRLPVLLRAGRLAGEISTPGGGAGGARRPREFGDGICCARCRIPGLEKTAEAAPDGARASSSSMCAATRPGSTTTSARAMDNGYAAFCLTVDTAIYSRRERDIAKRHRATAGCARATRPRFSGARSTGDDVERIKDKFKIPLILKGIATAEDATIAVEHGVDWVYVSNHGGRQLDHGRGSMRRAARGRRGGRRARQGHGRRQRSAAAPTSSRRSPSAPIWSASAGCSATALAAAGEDGVVRCSRSSRTR